jgi:hypothetical protein
MYRFGAIYHNDYSDIKQFYVMINNLLMWNFNKFEILCLIFINLNRVKGVYGIQTTNFSNQKNILIKFLDEA